MVVPTRRRAADYEAIRPLVELCKAGKLFEVQDWIASKHPVTGPPYPGKGAHRYSPLEVAIECGFHSLVKVLLDAGASIERNGTYCPMEHALSKRRLDMVQLLVDHGFDAKSVDFAQVFNTWDPQIMEYFVERGADIERDNALAWALCNNIRTAFGLLKKYRSQFPNAQRQLDIALRFHCREGNMKWISLMLWAGADPFSDGPAEPHEQLSEGYEGMSALQWAAIRRHYAVFDNKKIKLDPQNPACREIVLFLDSGPGVDVLRRLLEAGWNPNNEENGGCSAIQSHLTRLDWSSRFDRCGLFLERGQDDEGARDKIKAIHLLAKHGAFWRPRSNHDISHARKTLLKMTPDYTVEFIWIMAKYRACDWTHAEQLLRTPRIKSHTSRHESRLRELLDQLKSSRDAECELNPESHKAAQVSE